MIHLYDAVYLENARETLGEMLDYAVHSLHFDPGVFFELFIASGIGNRFAHGDVRLIAGMSGPELSYEVLERSGLEYERVRPRFTTGRSRESWCGSLLARWQWESGQPFERIMRDVSIQEMCSRYDARRQEVLEMLPWTAGAEERQTAVRDMGEQLASELIGEWGRNADVGRMAGRSQAETHLREADLSEPVRSFEHHNAEHSTGHNAGQSEDVSTADTAGNAGKHSTRLAELRRMSGYSQSRLAAVTGIPVRTIQQYEQRQKDLSRARADYLLSLAAALNCEPSDLL